MSVRIGHADLVSFSAALLRAAGLAEAHAEAVARLLVRGDLDGYPGHGIRRLVGSRRPVPGFDEVRLPGERARAVGGRRPGAAGDQAHAKLKRPPLTVATT